MRHPSLASRGGWGVISLRPCATWSLASMFGVGVVSWGLGWVPPWCPRRSRLGSGWVSAGHLHLWLLCIAQ